MLLTSGWYENLLYDIICSVGIETMYELANKNKQVQHDYNLYVSIATERTR